MYLNNVTQKNKKIKIEFEFADGNSCEVEKEKAEEFIIENIDKFEKKTFFPKGARRVPV